MQGSEDDKRCLIAIPKGRVWLSNSKSRSEKITLSQNVSVSGNSTRGQPTYSDFNLEKYLTVQKPASRKVFKKSSMLLPYRTYNINQRKKFREQHLAVPHTLRYKIIAAALRKRLHVDSEPDDVETITQIDEEFFDAVHSKVQCHQAPYKTLKHDFDNLIRLKQEIGYRNDCILKIDIERKREVKKYESSIKFFTKQLKYFEAFIAEDYNTSRVMLAKAEKLESRVKESQIELLNLANEQFLIMSRLVDLDYKYGVQQKYGRFLYYVSPPDWRAHHRDFAQSFEIKNFGFDLPRNESEDTFAVMYEKMQKYCYTQTVKPVLYFNHPRDLLNLFEDLRMQRLRVIIRGIPMSENVPKLKAHVEKTYESIRKETATLSNSIKTFKSVLEALEEQVNHLETKFYRILHGLFFHSVGTPQVLKFMTELKFCYEIITDNDLPVNLDMMTVAEAIESFYFHHVNNLEMMQNSTVHSAVIKAYNEEVIKMKKANTARINLHRFEVLRKKLLLAFGPGISKTKEQSELPKLYKSRKSKPGSKEKQNESDVEGNKSSLRLT